MSECDATVGQVAKGTTASFELGPHGASVCGRTEHALPGVEVVGVVFGLVAVGFVPVGGVFGGKIVPFEPVCGVFGGRIVPFVPVVGVFSCVGAVFGGIALGWVPAGGVGVDEIGVFGALGTVFVPVFRRSDGVCGDCAFAVGVFGAAAGETGAKRSASDGAGGADVDEATEEGAAERRLC